MRRYSTSRRFDRRYFSRTSGVRTRFNLRPVLMRGGFRL